MLARLHVQRPIETVGSDVQPPATPPTPRGRPIGFYDPDHVRFGFLFRLLVGLAAVLVGAAFCLMAGALTGWVLESWMLWFYGALVSVMILSGEHLRSRVYERLEIKRRVRAARSVQVDRLLSELGHPTHTRRHERARATGKRALDIFGALIILLLVAPLFLTIALFVKWDTGGPIFARQSRIGRDGRTFYLLSFRSQLSPPFDLGTPENRSATSLRDDPRFTRSGRFLRSTALDELPYIMNVFFGDISLVGPRPLSDAEAEALKNDPDLLAGLMAQKPGLVSASSVAHPHTEVDWHEARTVDLAFHQSATLRRELGLLLKTVPAALGSDRWGV